MKYGLFKLDFFFLTNHLVSKFLYGLPPSRGKFLCSRLKNLGFIPQTGKLSFLKLRKLKKIGNTPRLSIQSCFFTSGRPFF